MSIAAEYADFIEGVEYDDFSPAVTDFAKTLVQDHIGVSIGGGWYSPSAETFIRSVREISGEKGNGATVLATGEEMIPTYAAMLNGALAHSLDFDDTEAGHPGAPVISAALAMAEHTGVTGRELVEGVVVGYEVTCRLFQAVNRDAHYQRGFHPTATCGLFGATAATTCIADLCGPEIENAFGLNVSQLSGNHGYIRHGGWNKRLHPGIAAQSAVVATIFARNGFEGTDKPFEGYQNFFYAYTEDPNPEIATADLGAEFWLLRTGIKPYPCCRRLHTVIDIVLAIIDEHNVRVDAIESISVEVSEMTVENHAKPRELKYDPSDVFEAQFSLPFAIALPIVRGSYSLETLLETMDGGYESDLWEVMERITITSSDEIESLAREPGTRPARITITTTTDEYEGFERYSRGDPKNPLAQSELDAKFDELVVGLSPAKKRQLREDIHTLEEIPVSRITGLIRDEISSPIRDTTGRSSKDN